jgi:energy-coupling factor transporter ATP-binding protein EcfA2
MNVAGTPEYLRPEIVRLLKLLTEATRARPQGVPGAFIRPAGTDQAEADYHHFVFGQRGSGKSSLLRYLENLMAQEHRVSVWIDQEIFTDLAYPDVLVSCVLEITDSVASCLRREGMLEPRRGVSRILGKGKQPSGGLEERLIRISENLRVLKFAPLDAEIQWVHKIASSDQLDALGSVKAAGAGVSIGVRETESSEVTRMQTVVTSKGEYLERSLVDFRRVLKEAAEIANGGFVFVDDLYLIARSDQPRVLGYLHRLLKDTGFWLKIGSIRVATNNYVSSDPPVGMQTRHDAHDVALDRQFGLFDTTKSSLRLY